MEISHRLRARPWKSRCVLMWLFIPSRAARVNITAVRTPAAPGSQISTGTLFTHKTAAAGPRESGCSFHFHALFGFMSCINSPVICKHEIRGLESPTNQINTVYLICACKPCLSRINSLFMRVCCILTLRGCPPSGRPG